jgi:hypothetical protein
MFEHTWIALKAWFASYTHLHLQELTTRLGLLVAALATVLPNFAGSDVRIAYLAAAAGVILVLIKPSGPATGLGATP